MTAKVEHHERGERGIFLVREDGKRVAEMTYAKAGDNAINIDHTMVDEELRAKGLGGQLLAAAVRHAREKGLTIRATCPFAHKRLAADKESADVFAE